MSKWFNIVIVTKGGEIQAYYSGKLKKSIICRYNLNITIQI